MFFFFFLSLPFHFYFFFGSLRFHDTRESTLRGTNRRLCVLYIQTSSSESMFKVHCQAIVRMSLVRKRSAQRIAIHPPNRGEEEYFPTSEHLLSPVVSLFKGSSLRLVNKACRLLFELLDGSSVVKVICAPLTGLLRGHFVLIVVEMLPAEEETELRVVLLLVLSHLLKLGPIACDKLRQFVYDVP